MKFKVVPSNIFNSQISKFSKPTKRLIYNKIQMLKENPFRFKKIHSKIFSRVFRIRLNLDGKEGRLIYIVLSPRIILACLLNRKKDYKDLEKYLKKLKK